MQESAASPTQGASDGIFVNLAEGLSTMTPGKRLTLTGTVVEQGDGEDSLTALNHVSDVHDCGPADLPPAAIVDLPLTASEREALEAMRLSFTQALTVSDVYGLRDGNLTLSAAGLLWVPTEVTKPGAAARRYGQSNIEHSMAARLDATDRRFFQASSPVMAVSGVMGHDGGRSRLLLDSGITQTPTPDMMPAPRAGDDLRVVGMNLLNFFNGDGKGGGFPAERGPKTSEEHNRHAARIGAAVGVMQPQLLAVMELENDGFGPYSASASLLQILNTGGTGDWAVIDTGQDKVGEDQVTVGLFYRKAILRTEGPARLLDSPEFRGLSRQPMGQLFIERRSGTRFLVVVNHLKSKGSCPHEGENSDQGDGQACWNPARVAAARAMTTWTLELATQAGTERVLILGDMNAWRKEDPIAVFHEAGLVDLGRTFTDSEYTYIYRGEAGTLDYAFASSRLAAETSAVQIWHVNAAWPPYLALEQPWLRASDHDPVIVDLSFSQSETSD
jgi:predicted extracellular nuclease